jgi:hypothetical protein
LGSYKGTQIVTARQLLDLHAAVPEVVAGLATIPTKVVPTRLGIGCPGYHRKWI